MDLVSRAVPNEQSMYAALSDGSRVAVARANGRINVYDRGHLRFFRQDHDVVAIGISADGSTVAFGNAAGHVRVWDLTHDKVREHVFNGAGELAIALWPDGGRCLATWRRLVEKREESDGLVHLSMQAASTSTCVVLEGDRIVQSIELTGLCERIAITPEGKALLEIQVDQPWSHQVEEWTFRGEVLTRTPTSVTELPGPQRVSAGNVLSPPNAEGDVFLRALDGREGIASLKHPDAPLRVLSRPVFASGETKASTTGEVVMAVDSPWIGAKHRHRLRRKIGGPASIDAGFPSVRFSYDGGMLTYLALPGGEFLASNDSAWFGSPNAFDAGLICVRGCAYASAEAAASVLPMDPAVLDGFAHSVVDAKRKAAARKQRAEKQRAEKK